MINEGKFLSREIATLHSSQTEINAPEVVQQEPPWPQEHSWPEHTEFSYQDPSSKEAVFNNHHTHQTQHWPYEQYAAQPYGASSSSLPAQSSYTPVGFSEGPPEQRRNADILGLARSTFILLVLLGVVIIVAAVGGGVGGSIAVQNAHTQGAASDSASASPSTTNLAVVSTTTSSTSTRSAASGTATPFFTVPTEHVELELDCPNFNATTIVIPIQTQSWSYTMNCGVDYIGNSVDIITITSYSLNDCLLACSVYNWNLGKNGCIGVEFRADLSTEVKTRYGNCWLKNSVGQKTTSTEYRKVLATLDT